MLKDSFLWIYSTPTCSAHMLQYYLSKNSCASSQPWKDKDRDSFWAIFAFSDKERSKWWLPPRDLQMSFSRNIYLHSRIIMFFLLWQRRMGRYVSNTIEEQSLLNSDFISILYPKSMCRYHLALPVSPHRDWGSGNQSYDVTWLLLSLWVHCLCL